MAHNANNNGNIDPFYGEVTKYKQWRASVKRYHACQDDNDKHFGLTAPQVLQALRGQAKRLFDDDDPLEYRGAVVNGIGDASGLQKIFDRLDANYCLPKTSELFDIIEDFFECRAKKAGHIITEYISA